MISIKNMENQEQTEIQKRIEAMATNGNGYHDFSYPIIGRFSDPIQAHLGRMEEKNPSTNSHKQRFLQWVSGITALLDRAFEYRKWGHIFKHQDYEPFYDYYKKNFDLGHFKYSLSKNKFEDVVLSIVKYENIVRKDLKRYGLDSDYGMIPEFINKKHELNFRSITSEFINKEHELHLKFKESQYSRN